MAFRQILFPLTLLLFLLYTVLCLTRTFPGHVAPDILSAVMVFALMIGSQVVYRIQPCARIPFLSRMLVWVGSVLMGLWATYILFAVVIDLGNLILLLMHLIMAPVVLPDAPVLQEFLRHGLLALLTVVCAMGCVGFMQAVAGPAVKHVSVSIPHLPAALAGLRIAQLSDLHIGATIRREYIDHVVRRTMKLDAHIIAVTGDLADGSVGNLAPHAAPLGKLHAPLGVYFVTGNHEYYSGALEWLAEVTRLGMIPLLNAHKMVQYNGETIMIAGVTDITAHYFIPQHRSSPAQAIASPEAAALRLLLAHQPESCFEAAEAGFDLQLSGHTHAGQFFPFSLLVRLAKRFYRGLYRYKNMWVYVNAGTGYWGTANRFAIPSEITLLTLR